jgi:hypothetical protein
MVTMVVIIDRAAKEETVPELIDILLSKYKETNNLIASATDKDYFSKKDLKKKYDEFIKVTPKEFLNEFNIHTFEDYVFEYWNVLGFVGNDPIVSYNPEALFDYYEIDDICRKYDIDEYDVAEEADYLLDKDGVLYETEDHSYQHIGFVKILKKCNYQDYIVLISCQN